MAARDLLLPLLSYPLPLSTDAIERAVRLARGLSQAHGPDGRFPEIPTRVTGLVYEIELEAGLYFEGADFGSFLDQGRGVPGGGALTVFGGWAQALLT